MKHSSHGRHPRTLGLGLGGPCDISSWPGSCYRNKSASSSAGSSTIIRRTFFVSIRFGLVCMLCTFEQRRSHGTIMCLGRAVVLFVVQKSVRGVCTEGATTAQEYRKLVHG